MFDPSPYVCQCHNACKHTDLWCDRTHVLLLQIHYATHSQPPNTTCERDIGAVSCVCVSASHCTVQWRRKDDGKWCKSWENVEQHVNFAFHFLRIIINNILLHMIIIIIMNLIECVSEWASECVHAMVRHSCDNVKDSQCQIRLFAKMRRKAHQRNCYLCSTLSVPGVPPATGHHPTFSVLNYNLTISHNSV